MADDDDPSGRFIDQFEWHGMEPIYRADQIGPGHRVTIDEYHEFIGAYDRHSQILTALHIVGVVLVIVGSFYRQTAYFFKGPMDLWAAIATLILIRSAADSWLRRAPGRVLNARTPDLAALSPDDRLHHRAGRQSWKSLFVMPLILGTYISVIICISADAEKSWGYWFLLAVCVGLLARTAMLILRKWQLEYHSRSASIPM